MPGGTAQDVPATALVDRLVVASPDETVPYRRKEFGSGWDYDSATKCNTRELVLAEESGPGLVVDAKCKPQTGTWTSLYDGVVTHDPSDLEIDHLVPLADAWRSGADRWTPERRRAFANDLTDPATLVAVTSHSNRSKQDSTPAEWLPPNFDDRCRYVSDWVRVKYRWGLTVTPQEKSTLVQILSGC
ncbi:MAG: HNH endonuclease [Acidimicrobiales bacterium]|nr:HNH endonuclease [Acidimicrobiales bacterium]